MREAWFAVALATAGLCGCSRASVTGAELLVMVTDTSSAELFCTCSPDLPKHYEALRAAMKRALKRGVAGDAELLER